MRDLLRSSPEEFGRAYGKFYAEGHQRLASPIEAPAFAALAVAVLLVGQFNRRQNSKRLVLAVALGLAMKAGGIAAKATAVNVPAMAPLLYLVTLCPLLGALLLLLRPAVRRSAVAAGPARA